MKENKVSVIIPVFNSEKYIENCIKSVLRQNYNNIEIIIINDGSTDNSVKIINQINSDKIKLINQENKGPSSARNNGIKNSSGEWIMFLDSDDMLADNAISNLMKKSKNADYIISGWKAFFKNYTRYFGPIISSRLNEKEVEELASFLLSCGIKTDKEKINISSIEGPVAKLYSTKIIKDNNILFPENLCYAEDVCFNYSYLQYCTNVITLNKTVYHASRHDDSLSNNQKKLMVLQKEFEKEINKRNKNNWDIKNNVIYRYLYWTLVDLEKSSLINYEEFKKEFNNAKKLNFKKIDRKYLTKFKRIELNFLSYNVLIAYILFKIFSTLKKYKR